jgi:hypothetical protein
VKNQLKIESLKELNELLTFHSPLSTSLPTYQPIPYQPTSLSAYQPDSLPAYQPTSLTAYQPISLSA